MPQNTYVRTIWVNDSEPPLNADNLNKIEQGIVDAHIHMSAKDNPHGVTTEQIGAATKAEHDAHVDDKNLMVYYGTDWCRNHEHVLTLMIRIILMVSLRALVLQPKRNRLAIRIIS